MKTSYRSEGDGGGVGDKADARSVQGVEAQPHEHGRGDGHGRAEAGRAFNEGAEGEGDEKRLKATVIRQVGQGGFDDFKFPGFHGHVVHPNRGDDDPHDGEEAETGSHKSGVQGQGRGHAPDENGQKHGRGCADEGGVMPGGPSHGQHVEKNEQRNGRDKGGKQILRKTWGQRC